MQSSLTQQTSNNWKHGCPQGVVDGVTTNPASCSGRHKGPARGVLKACCLLVDHPLSVEVTSMIRKQLLGAGAQSPRGRAFASRYDRQWFGESCLGVMHGYPRKVRRERHPRSSRHQALLAAKAGATYVSIFGDASPMRGTIPRSPSERPAWLDDWALLRGSS